MHASAPFGQTDYWKRFKDDSSRFLYAVRDALNKQYGRTDVSSRRVAVTLDFTDIVTDVVPAFPRKGGGYLIPNGTGEWKSTNPPFHAQLINQADQVKAGRLKPLIRLMKAWNFANGHHLTSFHVELAVEGMWRQAPSIPDWPAVMAETLRVATGWLTGELADPWPDGGSISRYLSEGEGDIRDDQAAVGA